MTLYINLLTIRNEGLWLPVKYFQFFKLKTSKIKVGINTHPPDWRGGREISAFQRWLKELAQICEGWGLSYNIRIRMPLLNRNINHGIEGPQVQERVKTEEVSFDLSESGMEEGESKELVEGKWTQDENLRFVIFINYYQEIFSSKHKRKVCKIFKTFQEYLQDRKAAQCRSHYQKMIQKFKTVAKVKKHYENHFGKEYYRSEFEKFRAKWEETHPQVSSKDPFIKEYKEISIQTDELPLQQPQPLCCQCSLPLQSELPVQSASLPEFNPYIYWNQMNQMGLNYYCMFPPRSEETINLS